MFLGNWLVTILWETGSTQFSGRLAPHSFLEDAVLEFLGRLAPRNFLEDLIFSFLRASRRFLEDLIVTMPWEILFLFEGSVVPIR